ncbi:MAG TPA: hypothetical protein PKM39_04160, partial [Pseudothauera hydrothermalis]|nr:hypothetical protein [Pseudothauera hydrothermalis]
MICALQQNFYGCIAALNEKRAGGTRKFRRPVSVHAGKLGPAAWVLFFARGRQVGAAAMRHFGGHADALAQRRV